MTAADRETFAALADVLVPAAEDMPAASEVDVATMWVDRALEARPDLAAPLSRILSAARDRDPSAFLQALQADDPVAFDVLTTVAAGAYYLNPRVQELLGYTGQQAKQIDFFELPAYIDEGLLDEVVARGSIYRPTPD